MDFLVNINRTNYTICPLSLPLGDYAEMVGGEPMGGDVLHGSVMQ